MKRLALILALLSSPVDGHEALTGWKYDGACCSHQDCHHVTTRNIIPRADGWQVRLSPGEHPMVTREIDVLIPYGDSRIHKSGDEFFHACIGPMSQTIFCIYVPNFGY